MFKRLTLTRRELCVMVPTCLAAMYLPERGLAAMRARDAKDTVAAIRKLLETSGAGQYIGEEISIIDHLLQVSDRAGEAIGTPAARIAGFLHDIGHLFTDAPDIYGIINGQRVVVGKKDHDSRGAEQLKRWGFPPAVYEPVRLHVEAKRYLVAAAQRGGGTYVLSPASAESLKAQGGPMSAAEMEAFTANPHYQTALALRRAEEGGKRPGAKTTSVDDLLRLTTEFLVGLP